MTQMWITDGESYAVLDDLAALDEPLRVAGWVASEPPPDDGWVFMWREGIAEPGRYTAATLRETWGPRGWVAGPPPGGAHPAAPKPVAEPAAPKSSKPAAGDKVKEETGA